MLKQTHTVFDGYEAYYVYTCTYCDQQTRYPHGHTCTRLDLQNPPPDAMILRILENGNDAPTGRGGRPQVRHWTTPPYRASDDSYADTPEEEELREAALVFSESELDDSGAEARLYEAATAYAAAQAPDDEGETT